ncbi:MAG: NAD(P)/FAD-dependent oxidoreductase [Pseudomonadota bacterium]
MAVTSPASEPSGESYETDVVIIGAGPVGLFSVFELGLLGVRAHLVDTLDKPGGQCAELYPEKPILDIPAIKSITGEQLTEQLLDQIAPFDPKFHFGQKAVSLDKTTNDTWRLRTDLDTVIEAPVVCIAAGGGSFQPKKPPIPEIDAYEEKSVFYAVRKSEIFRDKTIVIAGGGDSALDWTLALAPIAKKLTLMHRRSDFRAAPDSVEKMHALLDAGEIDFKLGQIKRLVGADGLLEAVVGESKEEGAFELPCDNLIAFYGLTMSLGPVAEFGVHLHENRVRVDTEKFETSTPGIFCVGDMAWYPGKLKLILSGFHEAALMAHGAFHYVFPEKKLKFQHTTSSKNLQQKIVKA